MKFESLNYILANPINNLSAFHITEPNLIICLADDPYLQVRQDKLHLLEDVIPFFPCFQNFILCKLQEVLEKQYAKMED